MSARGVVLRRELGGTFRERTILLAIGIQVVIAGFSSFLVVGLGALVDPSSLPDRGQPTIAVPQGSLPRALEDQLTAHHVALSWQPDATAAREVVQRGAADGAMLAGGGDPWQVTLILPDGDLRATLTLVKAKAALQDWERGLRGQEASRLTYQPVYLQGASRDTGFEFIHTLLVPLLVFLPVLLAGALVADALTEEIQRGTLGLLLASPARLSDVVEGKLLASALLAPLLAASWLALLSLNGLGVPLEGAAGIVLLAFSAAVLMGVLACALALLTRERSTSQTMYTASFLLVLLATLAVPLSPVTAVARLASGSGGPDVDAVVLGTALAALAAWLALRLALARVRVLEPRPARTLAAR